MSLSRDLDLDLAFTPPPSLWGGGGREGTAARWAAVWMPLPMRAVLRATAEIFACTGLMRAEGTPMGEFAASRRSAWRSATKASVLGPRKGVSSIWSLRASRRRPDDPVRAPPTPTAAPPLSVAERPPLLALVLVLSVLNTIPSRISSTIPRSSASRRDSHGRSASTRTLLKSTGVDSASVNVIDESSFASASPYLASCSNLAPRNDIPPTTRLLHEMSEGAVRVSALGPLTDLIHDWFYGNG